MRTFALRAVVGLGVALSLTGCIFNDQDVPSAVLNAGPATQEVAPNAQASKALTVQVIDQNKDPIGDVDVVWSIKSGSGTLSATQTKTNDDGQASVMYTAGASTGTNTVLGNVPIVGTAVGFVIVVK